MPFMKFTALVILYTTYFRAAVSLDLLKQTNATTSSFVQAAGYPFEEHLVETDDEYILTLHRIPYSPRIFNASNGQPKPIAFLQHGIIASSSDWVLNGPENGLGFLLADNGFDVWMGNSRGNRYSMDHVITNSESPFYWDFSFHEMAIYDLPAAFDYISSQTAIGKFSYVGHSQGTTQFVVFCSLYPSCKRRILSAHLLSPVIFVKHSRSPIFKAFAPIFGNPDRAVELFGSFNSVPNSVFLHSLVKLFCKSTTDPEPICAKAAEFLAGPSNYINQTVLPFFIGALPAGSSFKQGQHFLQMYNSGKFRQFDYGEEFNKRIYGRSTPPEYDMGNVAAPIYLYYSENEFFAPEASVLQLASALPKAALRGIYKVPIDKFNHLDFLYGLDVKAALLDKVLSDIGKPIVL